MMDNTKFVSLWIKKAHKDKLSKMKVHDNQPYYEVVEMLINEHDKSNDELEMLNQFMSAYDQTGIFLDEESEPDRAISDSIMKKI